MKQIKRFFTIILSLSILVTLLPSISLTANAAEQWLWPAEGCYVVSSNFGHRKWWSSADQAWREDYHKGIDIVGDNGSLGQPVRATKSGTIYDSCNTIADNQHISGSRGNYVAIDHGDGTCSMYMHLRPYNVKTSGTVQQGDIIGYIGNTGDSDGAHLHFQLYTDRNNPGGSLINPMPTNSQIRIDNKSTYAVPSDWPQDWITYVFSASQFTVEDPTDISSRNATINCWVDNNGTMTQIGFYFGSSPEHMNRYVVTNEEISWTRFKLSYSISDYCGLLSPGCTYSYQFFYVNENGEAKSEIAEVTSAGSKIVSFDSFSLSNITETGAIVSAWLDNPNGYQLSSIGIEYGEYRDEMTSVEIVKNVGWTRSHLDYNLHDLGIYLLSGHTFYIKYYADVNDTRYYSDDFIVTTGAIVKYDTFAISDISSTSAQISAWISNPYGYQFSQIGFEYGESKTNYTRVLVTTHVSWTRAHLQYDFASFGVSLKPGTQYYYRFYSIIGDSIYYSTRQSFVTKDSPCATGHSYIYKFTTTPTISASGVLTGTCARCSATTTVTLPKLNTTDYSYSVVNAATCAATGTGRYTWKTTTYGSFYFDVTLAKTAHNYTTTVTAPTCTAQGYTTHTCTACGDSYKDTYIAALGHNYSYKVTTTPTTSATGVLTGTCSRCSETTTVTLPKLNTTDYSYSVVKVATCTATGTGRYTWKTTTYGSYYFDVALAKTAHNYTAAVTAPTCTAQGYTTHTCTACGDSYKDTYTAALGHNYSYKVTTTPTTSATGALTGSCSRCSGTTTVTLPKLNTTDYSYSVVKEATCTATGTGRYTWKTMTYGSFYFDVTIAKTAHNYTTTVTAPTCTAQGYTTHTCTACGDSYKDTYIAALGHSESTWIVDHNATCTASGSKHTECTRCGVVMQTATIAANGHTAGTWIIDKNATCTASGTKHTECTVCSATLETATIPAAGHSYTTSVTEPTCTAQGYTTHTCTICGDSYKDTYTTELGHAWDNGAVTTQPTETTEGVKTFTCTRCGVTKTESIPALGHEHHYTDTVTEPTCTEKGYTTHTCECGDSYNDTYVDVLGHAWDNGTVTTQPTETTEGVKTFTCTRCGITRTETIPATGNKPCEGGADCPSGKFVDVNPKEWYHPYVDYAVTHGLFGGTSANTFEPETAMTRAMLVTVLWRYEGEPEAGENTFSDVPNGQWYTNAVAWAAENGIVGGVGNNRFDPNGEITREQMATILFRYAEKKGIDTSKRGSLNIFSDEKQLSAYAKDAVQWAVAEQIINGSDGKLLPQGSATRAQVATILMRFIENIVKK